MNEASPDTGAAGAAPAAATVPAPSTGGTLAPAAAPVAAVTAEHYMAQAMVANGHWTEAQAAEALAKGAEQHDDGEEAAPEAPADNFDPFAAVADMKSTLAAVGIEGSDAGAAESIVQKGLARAPTYEQNVAEANDVHRMLEAQHGPQKAGWVIEWARREFNHLAAANPKLVDLAERSGAGNSIMLITKLAQRGQARYNAARFGKK